MRTAPLKLVRFASLLGVVVCAFAPRVAAQVVDIPDAGLRDAIRTALGKPTGDITVADMESLTELDASRDARGADAPLINSFEGLQTAGNLTRLDLHGSGVIVLFRNLGSGDLTPLAGLTNLTTLDLAVNQLTNLTLPADLTSLTMLWLYQNQFTDLTLPAELTNLTTLNLGYNRLADFSFLTGLTSLTTLYLWGNQLTSFTLPAALSGLSYLYLGNNPLTTLVLPEPTAGAVNPPVETLRSQGVAVYLYPLAVRLAVGQPTVAGTFTFTLDGPPGSYRVQASTDFSKWTDLDSVTNVAGSREFTDPSAGQWPQSFYRVKLEP